MDFINHYAFLFESYLASRIPFKLSGFLNTRVSGFQIIFAVLVAYMFVALTRLISHLLQSPATARALSFRSPKALSKLTSAFSGDEYKMTFLIRTDLPMTPGKTAAQCAHAVLANYRTLLNHPDGQRVLDSWEIAGQPKITLKVTSEEELLALYRQAKSKGLVSEYIRDAGRTQIKNGSITVCAVGPGPKTVIDEVTGHLKLY